MFFRNFDEDQTEETAKKINSGSKKITWQEEQDKEEEEVEEETDDDDDYEDDDDVSDGDQEESHEMRQKSVLHFNHSASSVQVPEVKKKKRIETLYNVVALDLAFGPVIAYQ